MDLTLKTGFSMLLEGVVTNPKELIQKGSGSGRKAGDIFKSIVAPFKKKQ